MNTPSKEALEASSAIVRSLGITQEDCDLLATIIDRHFEPLRQRAEQAEARVKELQKQEAESRRLFYSEQDKRQSAEYRCEELAWALRGMLARYAPTHSGLCGALRTDGTNEPCHCDESAQTARDVLARHAAGEPEAQT